MRFLIAARHRGLHDERIRLLGAQVAASPAIDGMALVSGTTLGPYSVTAKIGEGGMGEVYRAGTRSSTGTWH